MRDQQIDVADFCADLVSRREFEAFIARLLQHEKGRWAPLAEMAESLGLDSAPLVNVDPNLFVAWLDHPASPESYAVILFYDDESKWTMGADYNRQRFMERGAAP